MELSQSVEVGLKTVVTTKKLCEMVVYLVVLAVNPFPQVQYEPCDLSSSVLPIAEVLPVPESEFFRS